MSNWKPINTAPEGIMVLMFCPKANRGGPGCEVLMIYRDNDTGDAYWTNGGPNAGDDLYFRQGEEPTHWMELPADPV